MPDEDVAILIMVTAGGRNDAERLGEALVVERLAASCSVIPTIHSFYFADDLLQRDHEALLLVRTAASRRSEVLDYINEHQSHARPEIVELTLTLPSKPDLNR